MPIMRAASESCAVARIALPSRVRSTNRCNPTISSSAIVQISTSRNCNVAPPTSQRTTGIGLGKFIEPAPAVSRITLNRMKETPIVVIIAAVPRTLRSGRSAIRSMMTPSTPADSIVTMKAKPSEPTSSKPPNTVLCPDSPNNSSAHMPINELTMNTLK